MDGQSAQHRANRFRLFCTAWQPLRRGILARGWNGHRCRMGYTPGGYWASVDGVNLPDTFRDGDEAMRALFDAADPVPAEPVLVGPAGVETGAS